MATHGFLSEDINAPSSRFYQGRFGRMFRNLPAWEPEEENDDEKIKFINELSKNMVVDEKGDNPNLPAGYTYLGQFIDHDITFDPTSSLQRQNDPEKLYNFRTPRFDLDSVYGRGPSDQPYLYSQGEAGKFLIGENSNGEPDLPRNNDKSKDNGDPDKFNSKRTALIGDMRNDENILVSQIHLAFLKFHNKQIEDKDFETAQHMTRWHYQWIVIHDFLKRLCGDELVNELLSGDYPGEPKLHYYSFKEQPFMPVEFSVAAYRLHTMIRPSYHLNDTLTSIRDGRPLNIVGGEPKDNLSGFRVLPPSWTVQWDRFVNYNGSDPQKSRLIDTNLAKPLKDLHLGEIDHRHNSLAFRNILRGWRLGLPSGQDVARRMGIKEPLEGKDPLWIYILKEAEQLKGGHTLGPVGARIVAEVFVGLLAGDPQSYYSIYPDWKPEKVQNGSKFELADFLEMAGMPMTKAQTDKIMGVRA